MQVLPLGGMGEACGFHHGCTSTVGDNMREEGPEDHNVGFLKNLFANYCGK